MVVAGKLYGPSPMVLIENCVLCGADARFGRGPRFNTARYHYPLWVFLGLFLGVIPVILMAIFGRKTLLIPFSLCPECHRARRRRRHIAWGIWALLPVWLIGSIGLTLGGDVVLIGALVVFFAALTASFLASPPLQISGYEDGLFTVKGFGESFLRQRGVTPPVEA
jgi:hypothetical protein